MPIICPVSLLLLPLLAQPAAVALACRCRQRRPAAARPPRPLLLPLLCQQLSAQLQHRPLALQKHTLLPLQIVYRLCHLARHGRVQVALLLGAGFLQVEHSLPALRQLAHQRHLLRGHGRRRDREQQR
jgi:hypothetical protein